MMKRYLFLLITVLLSLTISLSSAGATQPEEGHDTIVQAQTVETTVESPNTPTVLKEEEKNLDVNEGLTSFVKKTGVLMLLEDDNWKCLVMMIIAGVLLYLAIVKKLEPLLLLPISFGMLLTNLPGAGLFNADLFACAHINWTDFTDKASLLDYLYLGVKFGIYPCIIFIGVGAMTDFGPLIANPRSLLLGAAAPVGIFVTYLCSVGFFGFDPNMAGSIGTIGSANGPIAVYLTSKLAPELLGSIAVATYLYMALVPVIQPPIMRALTTKKERQIVMGQTRHVTKTEKIIFPILVTVIVSLLLPSAAVLIGSLMLGNLMKESGVADRLCKTLQNELMNIATILFGLTVGATATASSFFNIQTLKILVLGIIAFGIGTAGGVLLAKFLNLFSKEKINPLIGSAGVSAVPLSARVSQNVGKETNPRNQLLIHAMGPNVAGVIGSAVAAGILLSFLS